MKPVHGVVDPSENGHNPLSNTQAPKPSLGRIVFIGAVHEAEAALAALLESPIEVVEVITVPEDSQPSGRVDLASLASAHKASLRRCADLNAPETLDHLRSLAPDLMVVVGWNRLLGPEVLSIPLRGCVGFHASLLPQNRGRAPVNWSIIRGETKTGNTMMYLDAGTDTGDIIDQLEVSIAQIDTCYTVYQKVAQAGATMLIGHLPGLMDGSAPRRRQASEPGEILLKRTPSMGITDWNRPATSVHNWVRGLTAPYPGAFSFLGGERLMLWESRDPCDEPVSGAPGEILAIDDLGIVVAANPGSVRITVVSETGAAPQGAAAWASSGAKLQGLRFDPVDPITSRWALGLGPAPLKRPI
ncbi:MAG: methionyl-tRNA formyltransferase [Acidimicrobiales bacterium]